MNRILIAVFATALLCGNLLAQSPEPPSGTPSTNSTTNPTNSGSAPPEVEPPSTGQNGQTAPVAAPANAPPVTTAAPSTLASGSVIPVQLTKSVDAKKVKTGDEIVAKVTQDLRNNAGAIVVAKDTKVLGHVTEAQARNKEQKGSEVTIAFDHMVPKNGEAMAVPMSIQAIIAPQNPNSPNASGSQPSSSAPAPQAGGSSNGRPGMGGGAGGTTVPPASIPQESGTSTGNQAQQPITGNTRGVVGMSNLNLAAAPDASRGSVVSSEKNNVRLDDGVLMLLRVN